MSDSTMIAESIFNAVNNITHNSLSLPMFYLKKNCVHVALKIRINRYLACQPHSPAFSAHIFQANNSCSFTVNGKKVKERILTLLIPFSYDKFKHELAWEQV